MVFAQGFLLGEFVFTKLSSPLAAKLHVEYKTFSKCKMVQTSSINLPSLEGPGLRTQPGKNVGYLFVCLFVCWSVTLLNDEVCERDIVIKPFKLRKDFDSIGYRKRFIVVHLIQLCPDAASWHHCRSLKSKILPNLEFSFLKCDKINRFR